jgi:hypothetical protein
MKHFEQVVATPGQVRVTVQRERTHAMDASRTIYPRGKLWIVVCARPGVLCWERASVECGCRMPGSIARALLARTEASGVKHSRFISVYQ